ncbi:ABC transporter permease [Roseomonas sp. GC11]|uniref:ABC transporter permease n=1 Tax=Roseomonas sp. GC11 TaxID=2950546 RepID=UPI00210F0B34|nr:ABC transporter permease [Roseomonas sp. GC11]MCQ4162494.1 ABC transporter permease [Roseomonas sp. GC11]
MSTGLHFTNVGRAPWHRRGFFASQTFYVAVAFALIALGMAILSPIFLSGGNLYNISKNFSFVAIVALGVTLVIVTGGIDLSVGSTMALVALVTVMTLNAVAGRFSGLPGLALGAALCAGLATSLAIGLINGVLVAKVGLSPFVTTLGMLSIARGLCYVITDGRGQAPQGDDAELLYSLADGQLLGLPMPVVYLLVLAGLLGLVLHHSAWGRHLFAIGGNERAARLCGVRVDAVKISAYVLSALAAGFAGVLMAGWLGSVPANLAFGYELRIIAASVIGGANLAGGAGGPLGAVLGSALIEVIRNGLVLGKVSPYWQDTLIGLIIILAVLVDRLRARRAG